MNRIEKRIKKVADSFVSYDNLYVKLEESYFDPEVVGDIITIDWMIEYFEKKEEYEKCNKLLKLKNNWPQ